MHPSYVFIVYPYRTENLLRLEFDLFVTSTLVIIKMNVVVFEPSVFYSLFFLLQLLPHLLSLSPSLHSVALLCAFNCKADDATMHRQSFSLH